MFVCTDVFGRVYDVNGEAAIDDVSSGTGKHAQQAKPPPPPPAAAATAAAGGAAAHSYAS